MDSILLFFEKMTSDPLLLSAVGLALGVILVNGWTDAPNAIATCVATRCLPVRAAILLAAVFNFFGVLIMTLLNSTVAQTVTHLVDFGNDSKLAIISLAAALFAIVSWAVLAWVFGIPTSESHALIAGLTGSAIALNGNFSAVNRAEWLKVIYGIIVSVVLGFGLGWVVCRAVVAVFKKVERAKTHLFFTAAQIVSAAFVAFMHGAQDGQKFMAVILLCVYMSQGQPVPESVSIPFWLMLLCSAVMALGTAMGGKRIIKAVGMDMVSLEKYQGFSADAGTALALLVCSLFSLPVSTTHAKTTAIMGVGAAKSASQINFSVVRELVLTWVLTFPGCGAVGFLMTKLFVALFA